MDQHAAYRGNERQISLLCLDGGGVRGLSSLRILQRIMECIDPSNPPKPCDYFDVICGTSTGGLIAIMLGRLKMSVSDCVVEYQKLSNSVFTKCRHRLNWKGKLQGRFDHEAFEVGIKDLLRRLGLPEDELMKEASGNPRCKTFVCSMSQQTSDIVVFPSYYTKTWGSAMLDRVRIWEAARATSAATSFFEPLIIDGKVFSDGATGANNPIYELWTEAASLYSCGDNWKLEDHLKCLVSIGTGIPSLKPFGPSIADVAAALKAIATASEAKAQLFQRQYPFLVKNSVFFRFNVAHGLEDIGLEDSSRLGEIESSTDRYCASPPVMQQIESCVEALKRRPWMISEAISKLDESRFEQPFLKNLYQNQSSSLSELEIERFTHTKAFQEWLSGDSNMIICTTSRQVATTACTLAACTAKYLEERNNYYVLYVDCFWLLETPRLKTLATNLIRELKADTVVDDSVDLITQSIYCQLFRYCPRRGDVLMSYINSLSSADASLFRSQLLDSGIPPKKNIWALIELLLLSTSTPILISIDRITGLEDSSRARITAALGLIRRVKEDARVLLCGDATLIGKDGELGVTIISEETEVKECLASLWFQEINVRKSQVPPAADGTASWIWNHSIYQSFAAEDSGILWIRGKPGSGKSVLARSIQRRLLEASVMKDLQVDTTLVGDWFYHRRRGGGYVRHESFVRSVLFHFLQQSPMLFNQVFRNIYRAMDPRKEVPWTYDLLVDIFTTICQSTVRVVCIVDAVDEAESTEILSLIKMVANPETRSKAKFIILSRPHLQIEREIEAESTIVVEDENANDIKKIIDLGLSSLHKSLHSLDFVRSTPPSTHPNRVQRRPNMRQPRFRSLATTASRENQAMSEVRDTLISKAQGSILWVKLILDGLRNEAEGNEGSTLEELREIVNRVPEELSDYYRHIVEELTDNKPPRRIREIRQALMWICAAAEIGDVTLDGLWEALAMLKDDFKATSLDEIWQKQILINSYDELWRKISSICGPFIEIFNPGLSAEESRIYNYGPSSIVQLMHQSVRDFLCDPEMSGSFHFTLDEARELIRNHLDRYLDLTMTDFHRMKLEPRQDPQLVVNWLNDQKILRLAIKASKNRLHAKRESMVATREWTLEKAPTGSSEDLLISTLRDYSHKEDNMDDECVRYTTMAIGRILYHSCMDGLVTAARNILALEWVTPDEAGSGHGRIILCYLLFAASICESSRVKAELDLYMDKNAAYLIRPLHDGPRMANDRVRHAIPMIPSRLRYCISSADLPSQVNREESLLNATKPYTIIALPVAALDAEHHLKAEDEVRAADFSKPVRHGAGTSASSLTFQNGERGENQTNNQAPLDSQSSTTGNDVSDARLEGSKFSDGPSNTKSNANANSETQGGSSDSNGRTTELTPTKSEAIQSETIPECKPVSNEYAETEWVQWPWTVILKINKEDTKFEQRITFKEWFPFLDILCGSKRLRMERREALGLGDGQGQGQEEEEEPMVAPIEDVEDTIIEALGLYRQVGH